MPTFKQGDMWSDYGQVDHFLITTNAYVTKDSRLVMGRGIAKQARDKFPGLDQYWGTTLLQHNMAHRPYHLILNDKDDPYPTLGAFQVKFHFRDEAHLGLIEYSAKALARHAYTDQTVIYALNFPGIGNGRLAYDQVRPLLDILPDNVTIWTF